MQKLVFLLMFFSGFAINNDTRNQVKAPEMFKGNFTDDYGIKYTINDSLWVQHPRTKYHIIKWDTTGQYIVARNDAGNPGEKGLYTRIDYMQFSNMEPWRWGFCLSVYDAPTDAIAESTAKADRQNPKKGCNGYPFSRMKRVEYDISVK